MSTRREVRNGRQFDLLATGRKISPMRSRGGVLVVVCTGVCFAGAHLSRAQEATSANLPDQFQTGEMIQIQKAKKKKAEATSQTLATVPTQDTAPVPEHTPPAAEEVPAQIAPAEEKKAEPNRSTASMPPSQKPATPTEQAPPAEEPAVVAVPAEKKPRPRKAAATCCANRRRRAFRRPFRCRFRWHNPWQSPRRCLITRTKRNAATSPEAVSAL